jgi:hypothetical protein
MLTSPIPHRKTIFWARCGFSLATFAGRYPLRVRYCESVARNKFGTSIPSDRDHGTTRRKLHAPTLLPCGEKVARHAPDGGRLAAVNTVAPLTGLAPRPHPPGRDLLLWLCHGRSHFAFCAFSRCKVAEGGRQAGRGRLPLLPPCLLHPLDDRHRPDRDAGNAGQEIDNLFLIVLETVGVELGGNRRVLRLLLFVLIQ